MDALSPLVTVLLGAEKTVLLSTGLAGHMTTWFSGHSINEDLSAV